MKRLSLALLVLALAAFAAAPALAADALKIGSQSPLTGDSAADGNDIANGVRTAIEVIKAQGGVPPFKTIEYQAEDDACDPKQAVAAANKLLNAGVSGVIGSYCSSSTLPASETLAEGNIVMITPASTNPKVTERGLKYMFRICGRDDDQAPVAVKFMKDQLKAKTVFIIDDKTTYSQGLADFVEKDAKAAGLNVLAHEHVNAGDKDFSAIVAMIKSKNPDAIYLSFQGSANGAPFVMQVKRAGIAAKIVSQDAVYHPQLVELAKDAAEGVFLTFGYTDKETPAYKTFAAKYKEVSKKDPGAYSAYAYDSAMSYFLAVKAAGGVDPAKVREQMLKLNFQGASKQIKFKENGDSGSDYIIYTVKGGQFAPYWNPLTGKLY